MQFSRGSFKLCRMKFTQLLCRLVFSQARESKISRGRISSCLILGIALLLAYERFALSSRAAETGSHVAALRNNVGTSQSFHGPVGLQLYSLRHHFQTNVPLALERVRDFGFVEIEGGGNYGYGNERFCQMLAASGLKTVSVFSDYKKLRDDPDSVIKNAKDFGASYVVVGWIPHEKGKFNEQNCREAIGMFNEAGRKLKAAG